MHVQFAYIALAGIASLAYVHAAPVGSGGIKSPRAGGKDEQESVPPLPIEQRYPPTFDYHARSTNPTKHTRVISYTDEYDDGPTDEPTLPERREAAPQILSSEYEGGRTGYWGGFVETPDVDIHPFKREADPEPKSEASKLEWIDLPIVCVTSPCPGDWVFDQ